MILITNELIFFFHVFIISLATFICLQFGKNGLSALVTLCFVLGNLFVLKQINLFSLSVTPTDAYFIGAALAINLLNEFYGRKEARKALYISLILGIFFVILGIIQLMYQPNQFDVFHNHFYALLSPTARIVAASLTAYFTSQTVEYILYAFLKQLLKGKYLIMRNWITLLTSQFIDTVLFSFLGLYGIIENIGSVILLSYTIKIITIFSMTPILWIIKRTRKVNNE